MGTGAAAGSITRDELLAQIASRVRHVTSIGGERLVIFELNGFLNFFPPLRATAFLAALVQTGYTIHLIAVTHLIVGVLLLASKSFRAATHRPVCALHRQQHRVSYCPRAVRIADGDRVPRLGAVPRVEVPGSLLPDAHGTRQRGVVAHAPRSHVWVLGHGPRTRCSRARPAP
jgi:hypothetical protein